MLLAFLKTLSMALQCGLLSTEKGREAQFPCLHIKTCFES